MTIPENFGGSDSFDANLSDLPQAQGQEQPVAPLETLQQQLQRLAHPTTEQRIATLLEALKEGDTGLALIVRSLQDPALQVQEMAYSLLRSSQNPAVRQALCQYNPWPLFECLQTLRASSHSINSVAIASLAATTYPWLPTGLGRRPWEEQIVIGGGGDQTVRLWNLHTGQVVRTLCGHSDWVLTVLPISDGQRLLSGGARWDNTVKVWNLTTGQVLHSFVNGHDTMHCPLALSPNGQTLVSGREDGSIRVWDLVTGQALRTLQSHAAPITALAIAPDGRILVTSSQGRLTVWNLGTGRELRTLDGHGSTITSLTISPDGRMLISGGLDNLIKVWALKTGQEIYTIAGHTAAVLTIAISPDGQTLISGSEDKTMRVWDLRTRRELCSLVGHGREVRSISISLDGQRIVSGSGDGSIKIWGIPDLN